MSAEPPREPQPGEPASGEPVPARRTRRRPTLLELSIWVGVAGTGIYAIGTGIAGMLDK